jgi:hypothetical protein
MSTAKERWVTDCYTLDEESRVRPWTNSEKKEIARKRKQGWDESRIRGWMKLGNNRKGDCPPLKERQPMATKKAPKKKVTKKKVVKKAAGRKAAAKPGRKAGGFQCGDKLTAVPGLDDKFYKKFPRYAAYQLICKKKTMDTSKFVDAIEKMDNVNSRGQALGILTKLLNKGCVKASGKVKKA